MKIKKFSSVCLLIISIFFATHTEVEIVELNPEDWMLFRDLRLQSIKEIPHAFGSTYQEELNETELNWKRRLKLNMIFAKSENQLVGMIGAVVDQREKIKHTSMLTSFYVIPEFRNQGISALLLKNTVDKLDSLGIKKILLKVTADQIKAIKLYTQFGFSIEGILKNEYLVNNKFYDQFIMSKFNKSVCINRNYINNSNSNFKLNELNFIQKYQKIT